MRSNLIFNSCLTLFLIFMANLSLAQGLSSKEFNFINPENIVWNSFPAFPEKVKLAILVGNPAKPEPFIVRVKSAKRRKNYASCPSRR